MKAKHLIVATLSALVLCFGLIGCSQQQSSSDQSSIQSSSEQQSSQSSSAEQMQSTEEEATPPPVIDYAKDIVGVWKNGDNQVAFDGKYFFSTESNLYTKYSINAEKKSYCNQWNKRND